MNKKLLASIVITAVVLAIGVAGGYWFGKASVNSSSMEEVFEQAPAKPLYYRSPMDPSITSPKPAKGPMGMDYIPVFEQAVTDQVEENSHAGTVRIDAVVQQNIGVRTATVKFSTLSHIVRAVGRISYDERRIVQLHPKSEGWIGDIFVDTTGEQVQEDTILLNLYSPKLVSSQQEYVLALKNQEMLKNSPVADIRTGAQALVRSSRARLELMDVPEHQIHELERSLTPQTNLHIHSPAAGIVTHIGVRKGQHVSPATALYTIADLSVVWAFADIFENEIAWVQVDDRVEVIVSALPGKTFPGRVAYIYPYAESKTRTVKIRIELENPGLLLKPETFAEILVHVSEQEDVTVIPSEAVIRSGTVEQVFIVRGAGKFEPRKVQLGLESNGRVVVIKGVSPGEEVVTSAQFLIDSESKLIEATAKMIEASRSGVKSSGDKGELIP